MYKKVVSGKNIIQIFNYKWLLLIVPLFYTLSVLYYPIINIIKLSFVDDSGFTLAHIKDVLTEPLYIEVLKNTFKIAFFVTILSLLISYPISYYMAITHSNKLKKFILGLVMITLWISLLVRTFTWSVILQDHGIVNRLLMNLGLIEQPLKLLYTNTSVVIGMTHVLIPYMILSLYSVMDSIDLRLIQAAQGLGARPSKAFYQVFLPLSAHGILSSSLIVFVMSLGYFITPSLLGGNNSMMISKLIEQNIQATLNWNLASALSILLLGATLLLLGISAWLSRFSPMIKEER